MHEKAVAVPPLRDARGREFAPLSHPRRLVSLVPSTTETLFALGLGESLVGYTRFCVHPADRVAAERWVGGTKNPKLEAIRALEPELILANLEENRREDIEALEEIAPVWVAFPRTVTEAVADLRGMGRLLGRAHTAINYANAIERELARLQAATERRRPWRYAYPIWAEPWMVAGDETFIHDLLAQARGENVFAGRYPEASLEALREADPDLILLPSEPYPFNESHRERLIEAGFRREQVQLVDGEYLSWHGVRLVEGLPYLRRLLGAAARRVVAAD